MPSVDPKFISDQLSACGGKLGIRQAFLKLSSSDVNGRNEFRDIRAEKFPRSLRK